MTMNFPDVSILQAIFVAASVVLPIYVMVVCVDKWSSPWRPWLKVIYEDAMALAILSMVVVVCTAIIAGIAWISPYWLAFFARLK